LSHRVQVTAATTGVGQAVASLPKLALQHPHLSQDNPPRAASRWQPGTSRNGCVRT
jgi:hypothetical protein